MILSLSCKLKRLTRCQILTYGESANMLSFPFEGQEMALQSTNPSPKLLAQDAVYKCGRASGYTKGSYSGLKGVHLVSEILNGRFVRRETFEHVIVGPRQTPFSLPGDSGSLVITEDGSVLGMAIAGQQMGPLVVMMHVEDLFHDIKTVTGAEVVRI